MRALRLFFATAVFGGLWGRPVAAETPLGLGQREPLGEAARFRLDLRAGVGIRNDTLTTGAFRAGASGGALSDLMLGGAWFRGRSPFGVAGRIELDRFTLRADSGGGDMPVPATGLEAYAALAGRVPSGGQTLLEGQLGYGAVQVPLASAPGADGALAANADSLRAHGPVLAALFVFAPADAFALEASGRFMPVSFGGRYQDTSVGVKRLVGGLAASIGRVTFADFRLAALVSYELASTSADEAGVTIKQVRHQIAFGLRATPHNPTPAPPPASTAVAAPGRIRGVVRLAAGQPVAGVAVTAAGDLVTTTAADGGFTLAPVAPGLIKVNLSRADLIPSVEVVSLPSGGEVTVQLTVRLAHAPAPTVLRGLVRGDDGNPIAARVRILETDLAARADPLGRFRFEVPAGRYTLTIDAPGFVTQRKSVRAGAGEQNIYNVDLQAER